MSTLFLIILSTVVIAALSLIGLVIMFVRQQHLNAVMLLLVALSAGAMLGNVTFHLLLKPLRWRRQEV